MAASGATGSEGMGGGAVKPTGPARQPKGSSTRGATPTAAVANPGGSSGPRVVTKNPQRPVGSKASNTVQS